MNNKIKIGLAFIGITIFIAGIFWFSTKTQNIQEKQTTQSRASNDVQGFVCAWKTADDKKHIYEVSLVDPAGNIIAEEKNFASDAVGPNAVNKYTFTNIPNEKLLAVQCRVKIIDKDCIPELVVDPKIRFCALPELTISGTGTPTQTPTGTITGTPTGTLTMTPTGTLTATPTGTPTGTPGVSKTGTPGVSSTGTPGAGTGTSTPGSGTATSTPGSGGGTGTGTGTGGGAGSGAGSSSGTTATTVPTAVSTAAAATATKAAASTATAVATNGATHTTTQSTTSLPASGTIHPAIILGIISLFIIALGLVF